MERIAAAAIKVDGTVYTGPHHHQIFRYVFALRKEKVFAEQGFITNTNRFVDRREGAAIAYHAGQIKEWTMCLFSEDMWHVHDNVFLGEQK